MRTSALTLAASLLALCTTSVIPVYADSIGTLTVFSGPMLQQIDNRPCVIGDPSCHNPAAIPYTLLPPHTQADVVSSPTYTVAELRNIIGGDSFDIGLDLNQAMGHDGGAYLLNSFTMSVDGATVFSTAPAQTLIPLSPGNGFSDATISGFSLAGLNPNARITFTTNFAEGSGGREQYFLQPTSLETQAGGPSTPEPASLLLLGTGALALLRRKRA